MINPKTFFQGLKSWKGSRSPAIPLGACFIALGALLKDAGFNLQQSAASSLFTYALPGQLVMAESLLVGASIVNIFIDVEVVYYYFTTGIPSHKFFHGILGVSIIGFSCFIISILLKQKKISSFMGCIIGAYSHYAIDYYYHNWGLYGIY